jgi:tol-pal system protein YbgF
MIVSMPRARLSAIALAAAVALPTFAALAQSPQRPAPGAKSAAAAAAAAAKDATPPSADPGLQHRVEQLEEQLTDMQVLVGTLESLARGAQAPARGAGSVGSDALSAADAGRLDAIETQVRALAAQLENLQDQIRGLAERPGAQAGGFGAVTVAPAAPKDDLDRVFPGSSSGTGSSSGAGAMAAKAVPAPGGGGGFAEAEVPPQQLYERAYGYLLQKDYGTAEASFDEFLKRNPTHQLAGNAQYWLGETFYVRGQYRPAAAAFLKGYQDYAKSQKASESLLKLAMSLQRLGQKEAACSSFSEFAAKYPNPPPHINKLAQTERQRSGC